MGLTYLISMGRVLAAVDIGSNTAHLLVGELAGSSIDKQVDESTWLSLGEVVGRLRCIPGPTQDTLVRTMSGYRSEAEKAGAEMMYCFATEAMRVAANNKEVLQRVEREAGVKVQMISAQREAELALRGTLLDIRMSNFMLVEVGGGSAQVARCLRKRIKDEVSLPLGTGTLIAKLGLCSPCDYGHLKRTQRVVQERLDETDIFDNAPQVVASGGVARGLWRALHPDGERTLHMEELNYLIWATQRLTGEEIVSRFQVKPKRALTLLPGAIVYREILHHAGHDEMTISRYGVREGALLDLGEGKVEGWRL